MSHRNYRRSATGVERERVEPVVDEVVDDVVEEEIEDTIIDGNAVEDEDTDTELIVGDSQIDAPKIGVITDCLELNVREKPSASAEVLCKIKCLAEVQIDDDGSTNEFYKICTATGIEGYCMKKYVSIRQ